MRLRTGYCRFCSVEKEDERLLIFKEGVLICNHCGRQLYLIPESDGSPYYYFEEVTQYGNE